MSDSSTAEVAEELQVHPTTVVYWIRKGWLKARKAGPGRNSHYRIARDNLAEFLRDHPEMTSTSDNSQK